MVGSELSILDALSTFLETLQPADRAVLDDALAEVSRAFGGALPVPHVCDGDVVWAVPEGEVRMRSEGGRLRWWGSYGDRVSLGDTVRSARGGPEAILRLGLLDFLGEVLRRRESLETLRDALIRELNIAQDRRRLLAYLSGATQLPEPRPQFALPGEAEYGRYLGMNEHSDEDKALGKIAFDAYSASKGGVTYDNKPIPPWENVGPDVQKGWIVAALAVKVEVLKP